MPRLNAPLVNEDGTVAIAWYRWFISMWNRMGLARSAQVSAVFGSQGPGGNVGIYDSFTGDFIGNIIFSEQIPGPAVPQTPTTSPFIYQATASGSLVVFGGACELSRDRGLNFFGVTLTGGAIPVRNGDQVRVKWYSTDLPQITFFPDSPTA